MHMDVGKRARARALESNKSLIQLLFAIESMENKTARGGPAEL